MVIIILSLLLLFYSDDDVKMPPVVFYICTVALQPLLPAKNAMSDHHVILLSYIPFPSEGKMDKKM